MIRWKRQGEAVIGSLGFRGGGGGQAVILGPSENPKGISVVEPGAEGQEPIVRPLREVRDRVDPVYLVEALCMQERLHGSSGLPSATIKE